MFAADMNFGVPSISVMLVTHQIQRVATFFFRKQAWDKNCHVYDLPCSKDLHHGFSKNGTDVFGVI